MLEKYKEVYVKAVREVHKLELKLAEYFGREPPSQGYPGGGGVPGHGGGGGGAVRPGGGAGGPGGGGGRPGDAGVNNFSTVFYFKIQIVKYNDILIKPLTKCLII